MSGNQNRASGITGAVRKTRNSSGCRATGRTISRAASDLNLASNPADETTVMPTVPSESCVSANRSGNATRRRKCRVVAASLKVVRLDFCMCADARTDRSYKPVLTVH